MRARRLALEDGHMDTETEAAMIIRNIGRYHALRLSCRDMHSLNFVSGLIDRAEERLSELDGRSLPLERHQAFAQRRRSHRDRLKA